MYPNVVFRVLPLCTIEHKARTCWYRLPFSLIYQYQFIKTYTKTHQQASSGNQIKIHILMQHFLIPINGWKIWCIWDLRLITLSPKWVLSKSSDSSVVWGGDPSCWNQYVSLLSSLCVPRDPRNLLRTSMYRCVFTERAFPESSSNQKVPMMPYVLIAT